MLTATPAGAELARRQAVAHGLDPGQRTWAGLVKPGELADDTEVYRAAREEVKRLLSEEATIRRIRIDAELKSIVAKRSETARARDGKAAADFVIHGNGRGASRVSKALGGSGSKGIRGLGRKGDPPAGGTRGPADRRRLGRAVAPLNRALTMRWEAQEAFWGFWGTPEALNSQPAPQSSRLLGGGVSGARPCRIFEA